MFRWLGLGTGVLKREVVLLADVDELRIFLQRTMDFVVCRIVGINELSFGFSRFLYLTFTTMCHFQILDRVVKHTLFIGQWIKQLH